MSGVDGYYASSKSVVETVSPLVRLSVTTGLKFSKLLDTAADANLEILRPQPCALGRRVAHWLRALGMGTNGRELEYHDREPQERLCQHHLQTTVYS